MADSLGIIIRASRGQIWIFGFLIHNLLALSLFFVDRQFDRGQYTGSGQVIVLIPSGISNNVLDTLSLNPIFFWVFKAKFKVINIVTCYPNIKIGHHALMR